MKVIFDFDDVIFNTKHFKEIMFQTLEAAGYKSASTKYADTRKQGGVFSLRSFIAQVIADSSEENVDMLYSEIMNLCRECVNDEVRTLMEKLGQENCYIVTHGDQEFQEEKIRKSIGEGLVQQVIIVKGSKAEAIKEICDRYPKEEIIFVDDKILFLNDIWFEDCPNLKTVLFNENGIINLHAEINESLRNEEKSSIFGNKNETLQSAPTNFPSQGLH